MAGKVTLVGAGPGDAGLITVKGREALLSAEVVVYDRLVGEDILALMPVSAEKIDAGKASANHKIPQHEINRILLEKAQEGKNVVRLKGGDCYLFGRGGEELELLYENSIDFEVIPGITSALAVPAYAGIPVTHREYASSVHIITAHAKAGKELDIDFEACVRLGGTLVFLMGVANMKYIANGLICGGKSPDTPCAVIENGTKWGQKKYTGTLGTITETARDAKSPSVIVVGEVCELNEKYDWFSRLPLFGCTAVVTRPTERAGTLADALRERGAHVIVCPCIQTESLMNTKSTALVVDEIKKSSCVVFTSPAGVKCVMKALFDSGRDSRIFAGARLAAIGSATAAELLKYGLCADMVPQTYDGEGLGEMLRKNASGDDRLLLLRAGNSNKRLNEILDESGIIYNELAVYKTVEICENNLTDEINSGRVDFVTFTSASTVRGFVRGHKNIDKTKIIAVCIGKTTAAQAEQNGFRCIVSPMAKISEMIKTIEGYRWNI